MMLSIVRNILAVVLGAFVCLLVNGGIISQSASIIPPPAGVDPRDLENLKQNIHLFQPQHFIMPFLALALGKPRKEREHVVHVLFDLRPVAPLERPHLEVLDDRHP